ncbi:MAG: HAD hydrolase-like protein [Candidatus Moranbacteria bacterium]|nr:HAD hydrolase-like protein [Candidatus Moranbacteria bacterium]
MNKEQFENYLQEKNKNHIIFDFDATLCTLLVDWNPWRKEMDDIFSELGLNVDRSSNFNYSEMLNRCVEKGGDAMRDRIMEMNYNVEKNFSSGYDLSPLAMPLLELSKTNADLYLWTSNDKRTIMPILEELNWVKFFKKIVTRNDVRYIKPSADGFALIYDENVPKSQYLLIGDSRSDSGAAQAAGIDFLNIDEFEEDKFIK